MKVKKEGREEWRIKEKRKEGRKEGKKRKEKEGHTNSNHIIYFKKRRLCFILVMFLF